MLSTSVIVTQLLHSVFCLIRGGIFKNTYEGAYIIYLHMIVVVVAVVYMYLFVGVYFLL